VFFPFIVVAFDFYPFTDVLRKILRSLTRKVLDFLQKATKRTKVFAAAEDKVFVSFVVFCLESSPVLRASTPPEASRPAFAQPWHGRQRGG
jgi:hypothetical protein